MTRRLARTAATLLLLPALSFATASCSSSSPKETSAETNVAVGAANGEAYELVSDEAVAAGFAKVKPLVSDAAAQIAADDKKSAAATVTAYYTEWYTFEGTIRKVDQSRYLDLEDALGSVKTASKSGDKAKAITGASEFTRLADAYLADHPTGSASVSSEVAAATAGPAIAKDVQLGDYALVAPDNLAAGTYEFTIDNVGKLAHEMVVFRTDLDPKDIPLDAEGGADEKGKGMALVDEQEDIKAGATEKLRVDLPAGRYVFGCNVAGHWAKKMYRVVTVK